MSTLLRTLHKSQLQSILQSITFEGANLSVNIGYTNIGITDPYLFISSDKLRPNITGESMMDNETYRRSYFYYLTAAFRYADTNGVPDNNQEARMDALEELILNTLQDSAVRDNTNWSDLIVGDITGAFNPDPSFTDNLIYKSFEIEIRDDVNIYDLP
jgi:hypothetical protein